MATRFNASRNNLVRKAKHTSMGFEHLEGRKLMAADAFAVQDSPSSSIEAELAETVSELAAMVESQIGAETISRLQVFNEQEMLQLMRMVDQTEHQAWQRIVENSDVPDLGQALADPVMHRHVVDLVILELVEVPNEDALRMVRVEQIVDQLVDQSHGESAANEAVDHSNGDVGGIENLQPEDIVADEQDPNPQNDPPAQGDPAKPGRPNDQPQDESPQGPQGEQQGGGQGGQAGGQQAGGDAQAPQKKVIDKEAVKKAKRNFERAWRRLQVELDRLRNDLQAGLDPTQEQIQDRMRRLRGADVNELRKEIEDAKKAKAKAEKELEYETEKRAEPRPSEVEHHQKEIQAAQERIEKAQKALEEKARAELRRIHLPRAADRLRRIERMKSLLANFKESLKQVADAAQCPDIAKLVGELEKSTDAALDHARKALEAAKAGQLDAALAQYKAMDSALNKAKQQVENLCNKVNGLLE